MKRLFLFLSILWIIFLLTGNTAFADPFLTADCTPAVEKVTGFQLQLGTAPWTDQAAVLTCGSDPATKVTCTGDSKTLCYDLATLPTGPFTAKARAKNLWGTSTDSAPLSDSKLLPSGLPSMRIIR